MSADLFVVTPLFRRLVAMACRNFFSNDDRFVVNLIYYQLNVAMVERSVCAIDKPLHVQLPPSEQCSRKGGVKTLNRFYSISLDIGRRFDPKRCRGHFSTGADFADHVDLT